MVTDSARDDRICSACGLVLGRAEDFFACEAPVQENALAAHAGAPPPPHPVLACISGLAGTMSLGRSTVAWAEEIARDANARAPVRGDASCRARASACLFVACKVDGGIERTQAEIAAVAGVRPGAVRKTVDRLRRTLRDKPYARAVDALTRPGAVVPRILGALLPVVGKADRARRARWRTRAEELAGRAVVGRCVGRYPSTVAMASVFLTLKEAGETKGNAIIRTMVEAFGGSFTAVRQCARDMEPLLLD